MNTPTDPELLMKIPQYVMLAALAISGMAVADEYLPYYGSQYGPYYYDSWNHSWGYTQSTGDGEGSFSFSMSSKIKGESSSDMNGSGSSYGGNTPRYPYPPPSYPPVNQQQR